MILDVFRHRESHVEVVFDKFVTELESQIPGSPEAEAICKQVETLAKVVNSTRDHDEARINTVLAGAMSLLGIAGILTYEYTGHVITSKAFGFVEKIRQK